MLRHTDFDMKAEPDIRCALHIGLLCGTEPTLDDVLRMAALPVLQVQRKTSGGKPTIAKAARRLESCC